MKPFVKLKDTSLTFAEELSLDSKPRLSGRLRGFTDDLMQVDEEGVKYARQHDPDIVVPVRSVVNLVGEDVIIEGVKT
jgi:hypothetical protein